MYSLFISVLNMSFTGSLLIMLVLIARLPLKKVPKIYSYLLWLVPMLRLVFPFSIESAYSLIPANPQPIPRDIAISPKPQINTGITILNNNANAYLTDYPISDRVNTLQVFITTGCIVWLLGVAAIIIYNFISYIRLKLMLLSHSKNIGNNIYVCDKINIPFVLGMLCPKIYLPSSLAEDEQSFIILHEKTHIKRLDYIVKFIYWLIRTLHWFNPIIWAAYRLMERDMEMSCDEAVIAKSKKDIKTEYSSSLLHFASAKVDSKLPVAFGNANVKDRIKNIISYKKPPFIVVILLIIAVGVFGLVCMLSPKQAPVDLSEQTTAEVSEQTVAPIQQEISAEQTDNYFYTLISDENQITTIRKEDFTDWLNSLSFTEIEKPPHIDEITSDYIVYATDREYKIYSDYTLSVKSENEQHYYTITKENYDKLFFYFAIRSNVSPYGSKEKPDSFKYTGDDPLLQLAYGTEMSSAPENGFKVTSIKLFDYSLEENKLKIFVTVYDETYTINEKEVMCVGGSVMCKAITFTGNTVQQGGYIDVNNYISNPAEVVNSSDGSLWQPSIEAFCTTPITGKKIEGLANKIIRHYSDYSDLQRLQREHLIQTLNENGFKDMYLVTTYDNSREKLN